MKKVIFIFLYLPFFVFAQEHINLRNSILDSIKFYNIGNANIYNFDFKNYIFTIKTLNFEFYEKKKDTNDYNLPETYAEFKKEFLNTNFTKESKNLIDTKLTKEEKINAIVASGDLVAYNINKYIKLKYVSVTPGTTGVGVALSPITYLYDKFSRKAKMDRLYQDLVANLEEVYNLSQKYNQDLVASLTGLEGEELLNFMTFCKFSYYDLIHWTPEFIILQIKKRYGDYEYYKAIEEDY